MAPATVSAFILYVSPSFPCPTGAMTGIRPPNINVSINVESILVGSPTNPKSTTFSILLSGSVLVLSNRFAVIRLASFPEIPTARPPASLIAATIDLLMDPAKTISTISTVASSVTRRPSINSLFIAIRSSISPICGPPPCTTRGLVPTCFNNTISDANVLKRLLSPIA